MLRFYCDTCKGEFPSLLVPAGARLEDARCPYCGSDNYWEVDNCPRCGKRISSCDKFGAFCPDCAEQTLKRFRADLKIILHRYKQEDIGCLEIYFADCYEFKKTLEAVDNV